MPLGDLRAVRSAGSLTCGHFACWLDGGVDDYPSPCIPKKPSVLSPQGQLVLLVLLLSSDKGYAGGPHTSKVLCDLGPATSLHLFLFVGWE